ncbi:hypothetical protein B0H19DRAFT_1074246 [Mycena capillaripes]|nr:hypothetical protein B0H19DRAFT_1074246 [Mycena capillaripes]
MTRSLAKPVSATSLHVVEPGRQKGWGGGTCVLREIAHRPRLWRNELRTTKSRGPTCGYVGAACAKSCRAGLCGIAPAVRACKVVISHGRCGCDYGVPFSGRSPRVPRTRNARGRMRGTMGKCAQNAEWGKNIAQNGRITTRTRFLAFCAIGTRGRGCGGRRGRHARCTKCAKCRVVRTHNSEDVEGKVLAFPMLVTRGEDAGEGAEAVRGTTSVPARWCQRKKEKNALGTGLKRDWETLQSVRRMVGNTPPISFVQPTRDQPTKPP